MNTLSSITSNVIDSSRPSNTNIVSRVVSWLFSISTTTTQTSSTTKADIQLMPPMASSPATITRPQRLDLWTRNHYLLLDHYYTLSAYNTFTPMTTNTISKHPPPRTRGPPLPLAYYTPLVDLPAALTKHLDLPVTTQHPSLHPCGTVTERWLRVAHSFIEVAKEQGVPLLCDGALDPHSTDDDVSTPPGALAPSAGTKAPKIAANSNVRGGTKPREEEKYPKRGPDGHVLREREDWRGREWEVIRRVYSLWVRDVLVSRQQEGAVGEDMSGGGSGNAGMRLGGVRGAAELQRGQIEEMQREEEKGGMLDEALVREVERRTEEWVGRRTAGIR